MINEPPLATLDYENGVRDDSASFIRIAAMTLLIYGVATCMWLLLQHLTGIFGRPIVLTSWLYAILDALWAILIAASGYSLSRRQWLATPLLRTACLIAGLKSAVIVFMMLAAYSTELNGQIWKTEFYACLSTLICRFIADLAIAIGIYRLTGTQAVRQYMRS